MGHGVDAHLPQSLLNVGVPVILDFVISSPWEMRGNLGPSATALGSIDTMTYPSQKKNDDLSVYAS